MPLRRSEAIFGAWSTNAFQRSSIHMRRRPGRMQLSGRMPLALGQAKVRIRHVFDRLSGLTGLESWPEYCLSFVDFSFGCSMKTLYPGALASGCERRVASPSSFVNCLRAPVQNLSKEVCAAIVTCKMLVLLHLCLNHLHNVLDVRYQH